MTTANLQSQYHNNTLSLHNMRGLELMVFWCIISLASCMSGGLVQGKKILLFWSRKSGPGTELPPHAQSPWTLLWPWTCMGFYPSLFLPPITNPPVSALINVVASKIYKRHTWQKWALQIKLRTIELVLFPQVTYSKLTCQDPATPHGIQWRRDLQVEARCHMPCITCFLFNCIIGANNLTYYKLSCIKNMGSFISMADLILL